MFGLFAPKCPLEDPREKAWTELAMLWLAEQFGIDRLRTATVLTPTVDDFPDPYQGTDEEVESLMHRLCQHMQIDPGKLELQIHDAVKMPDAADIAEPTEDGKAIIRVSQKHLLDLESLLASLSNELSLQLLQGQNRLKKETPNHEMLGDLLPVFLGLGVFGANATIRETIVPTGGRYYTKQMNRQGYLPSQNFGYALALFAWIRGETKPAWAKILRLDARNVFHNSLKYLRKTNDSLFRPDWTGTNRDGLSLPDLIDDLAGPYPGRHVAALWEIAERKLSSEQAKEAVLKATWDNHPAVRTEAATVLPIIGADDENTVQRLAEMLRDSKSEVRAAAAMALGNCVEHSERAVDELTATLADLNMNVVLAATVALSQFGFAAERAAESLIAPLRSVLVSCEFEMIDLFIGVLFAIHTEPETFLLENYRDDEDLLHRAEESLNANRPEPSADDQ